jgi:hypothetical protein
MHMTKPARLTRRDILGALTAVGGAALAGACSSSDSPTSPTTSTSTGSASAGGTSATGACAVIPSETAGPYPDRTGMIDNPAFYRQDITEGKPGTPREFENRDPTPLSVH